MHESKIEVKLFEESLREDFFELHSDKNGCGWCYCVGWWVPTWDGWGERRAEQNRQLRERLLAEGEYDGYLLYRDDQPVGWCQVGRRDRLNKILKQFSLAPDEEVWAITCFLIAPPFRRTGLAKQLLLEVLQQLENEGVTKVMAFPKKGGGLDERDLWNGPASMYLSNGFQSVGEDDHRLILLRDLARKR